MTVSAVPARFERAWMEREVLAFEVTTKLAVPSSEQHIAEAEYTYCVVALSAAAMLF